MTYHFKFLEEKNVLNKEIEPYNYYGLSKLTSEKILKNWCKFNYVDLIIFRYPRIVCENLKFSVKNGSKCHEIFYN